MSNPSLLRDFSLPTWFVTRWSYILELMYGRYPEPVQVHLLTHAPDLSHLAIALERGNVRCAARARARLTVAMQQLQDDVAAWEQARRVAAYLGTRARVATTPAAVEEMLDVLQFHGANLVLAQVYSYRQRDVAFTQWAQESGGRPAPSCLASLQLGKPY